MTMKSMKVFGSIGLIGFIMWTSLLGCGGQQAQSNENVAASKREIGEAYMHQGDYTSALRELIEAERLNPSDHFVHNDLGLCYMNLSRKRMSEAIGHFKRAVDLKPNYTPARNNLGTAYLVVEEWDAAIATFKEITHDALYAKPHYPLANLGFAYYQKGDYTSSLNYYKEALKIQPDFANAQFGAGRTYLALNQGRLALRYLERAAQLAPKLPDIHFNLGEAYLLTGQMARARSAYESVIDLAPQDSELVMKARQRLGVNR
jgi:tetratricopeptide (TPR) repeat protein